MTTSIEQGTVLVVDDVEVNRILARAYLEPPMRRILEREALPGSLSACRIVPAKLGKNLGNYGAVCAALYESDEWNGLKN